MFEKSLSVLAFYSEYGNAVVLHETRGNVVLRGERVRGAERHLCPAGLQRYHEIRGLCGDVEAGGEPMPFKRLILLKLFLHLCKYRHVLSGPCDALRSLR